MRHSIPAALLCLALALSPLAPGLAASIADKDAALDEAQELLNWAYDVTPATLSLFRCDVEDSGDGTWHITYTGDMPYPEPLGEYTVTLYPEALPDVRWSHDENYLPDFSDGNLDAPVWGQTQLAQAYDTIVHPEPAVIDPLLWLELDPHDSLEAGIVSPSGEANCSLRVDARSRTLPEGPLDAYRQAVSEFLADGALYYRNATEKADITQRIYEAGLSDLLDSAEMYAFPGPEDLPEEEALAAARSALEKAYTFTPEAFSLFDVYTTLIAYPDRHLWVVDFSHTATLEAWLEPIALKLGAYQVTLAADTGEILSANWDKAFLDTGVLYTRQNWGFLYNSPNDETALPPHALPWLAELYGKLSAIATQYPEDAWDAYSTRDITAIHTMLRESGFPRSRYFLAVPRPGDISRSLAALRAKAVLSQDLRLSQDVVDAAELSVAYSVAEAGGPVWDCYINLEDGELWTAYLVQVDAATGKVLSGISRMKG